MNVIFLAMSCQKDFFKKEVDVVKKTWAKDVIDNKLDNVKFYYYDGSHETSEIDEDEHHIKLDCGDDNFSTFTKTKQAMKLICEKYDADYIIRTNTSTYINIPLTLKLLNKIKENELWCSEIYKLVYKNEDFFHPRGNYIIFNKEQINKIINSDIDEKSFEGEFADDFIFGKIFDDVSTYMTVPQYWYKCSTQVPLWSGQDDSLDNLRKYPCIQVRKYNTSNRETEFEELEHIYDVLKDSTPTDDDIEYVLDFNYNKNKQVWCDAKYYLPMRFDGYKNDNLDIFICAHKDFDVYPKNDVYKVVHGDEKINVDLPQIVEGNGDSLITKQQLYGEGSRIYWIWKHCELKDYVGFCHYSKYFGFYDNVPNMDEIFKKWDCVATRPLNVKNLFKQYTKCHNNDDLVWLSQIIKRQHPQMFKKFVYVMMNPFLFSCNMFIMKKEDFIKYCEFVFPILQEFDMLRNFRTSKDAKNYVIKNKDKYIKKFAPNNSIDYQSRIDGFLLERLTTTYLLTNFKSILKCNIKTVDNKYNKNLFK